MLIEVIYLSEYPMEAVHTPLSWNLGEALSVEELQRVYTARSHPVRHLDRRNVQKPEEVW